MGHKRARSDTSSVDRQEEQLFDVSPEQIRELLRRLRQPQRAGQMSLARLPEVDRILVQLNLRDSPSNRGIVLGMIIEDLVLGGSKQSGRDELAWTVLDLLYLRERPRSEVERTLGLSPRSLSRYAERGLALLAQAMLRTLANHPPTTPQ